MLLWRCVGINECCAAAARMWQRERAMGQRAHLMRRECPSQSKKLLAALSLTRLFFTHLSSQLLVISFLRRLLSSLLRTYKVYVQYNCTQRLAKDKELTRLVETDGNMECNYNERSKGLALRARCDDLQSTTVSWDLNKIYVRQRLQFSHSTTKDRDWNLLPFAQRLCSKIPMSPFE